MNNCPKSPKSIRAKGKGNEDPVHFKLSLLKPRHKSGGNKKSRKKALDIEFGNTNITAENTGYHKPSKSSNENEREAAEFIIRKPKKSDVMKNDAVIGNDQETSKSIDKDGKKDPETNELFAQQTIKRVRRKSVVDNVSEVDPEGLQLIDKRKKKRERKSKSESIIENNTIDENTDSSKLTDEYERSKDNSDIEPLKKRKRLKSDTKESKSPEKVKLESNILESFNNTVVDKGSEASESVDKNGRLEGSKKSEICSNLTTMENDNKQSTTINKKNKNEEHTESSAIKIKKTRKSETPKKANKMYLDNSKSIVNNTIMNYYSKTSKSFNEHNLNEDPEKLEMIAKPTKNVKKKQISESNIDIAMDTDTYNITDEDIKEENDTERSVINAVESKKKGRPKTHKQVKTHLKESESCNNNTIIDNNSATSKVIDKTDRFNEMESYNSEPIIDLVRNLNLTEYSEQPQIIAKRKRPGNKQNSELSFNNSTQNTDTSILIDEGIGVENHTESSELTAKQHKANTDTIELESLNNIEEDNIPGTSKSFKKNGSFKEIESHNLEPIINHTTTENGAEMSNDENEENAQPNDVIAVEQTPTKRGRGRPKSNTPKPPKVKIPKTVKINLAKNLGKVKKLKPGGKITKESIKATSLRKIPESRLQNALAMLKEEDHPIYVDNNLSCNAGIHRYWEPRNALLSDQNMKLKYARQFLLRRDWVNLSKILRLTTIDKNNYYPLLTKYATLCLAHTDKEQFDKFVQFLVGINEGCGVVMKKCTTNAFLNM